jgi:putative NADH-flavin reductase
LSSYLDFEILKQEPRMTASPHPSDRALTIAVIGASGGVGSRLVAESLRRGHRVTAVARRQPGPGLHDKRVQPLRCDIEQAPDLSPITGSHDVVICTLRPPGGQEAKLAPLTAHVVNAAVQTGTRFVVVGGAARLRLPDDPKHTVLTAPGFLPEAYVPIARASQRQYEWVLPRLGRLGTYLSPPAVIEPGPRTGAYRIGLDTLVVDAHGDSKISFEDFAVALLDEIERPSHTGTPFTVGY